MSNKQHEQTGKKKRILSNTMCLAGSDLESSLKVKILEALEGFLKGTKQKV